MAPEALHPELPAELLHGLLYRVCVPPESAPVRLSQFRQPACHCRAGNRPFADEVAQRLQLACTTDHAVPQPEESCFLIDNLPPAIGCGVKVTVLQAS
eukprot:CAMPEP_0176136896 /NCGR_PEP_ID=MMETSP0120_2-20121206/69486_1 /TAXON_ID=160619 /ORGANISM="Kryptoperidinium foliaceum, Strain CCMP 1326" /LENGTH=97 /DNA_ID=CAMNT_0017472705 /DNA_START=39 /DNA_END=329 /DNA_ORIENTATION=+